ncbi:MATE family efflux transporter [Paenibacillus durus]|uniref:Multidrug transporter MatE n=1 Tax=Paenibacillus durus TaxID=44251 RepID=A0A089HQ36_PAEDU|nr:MATE family efflux transporter [Paenibacillus durus]AIQ12468.1 hypothetical protein PDUR_11565 [Paenibacillus durus]
MGDFNSDLNDPSKGEALTTSDKSRKARKSAPQPLDLFNGPIALTTLKLGIPILISQSVLFAHMMVDTFFISLIDRSSTALLSGTGLVYSIYLIIYYISCSLFMATSSVTARGLGQKNEVLIKRTGDSGLFLASVISVITLVVCSIFGRNIIEHLSGSKMSAEAIQYGVDYLYYMIPGMVFQLLMTTIGGILQGEGKAKEIGIAVTASTIINIILNPILIFGFNMGVKGSALATSISVGLTVVYYLSFFVRGKTTMQIQGRLFALNSKIIKEILYIGIPASIGFLLINTATMILNNVVGSISEASMNAWVLVSRTDQMFLIPAFAIGLSTIPMIGQNFGGENFKRCDKIFSTNIRICMISGLVLAALYMLFAPQIFQQFSSVQDVIDNSVRQVRLLTLTSIGLAGIIVTSFAFQAIGKPMPNLVSDTLRMLITSFPVLLPLLHFPIKNMNLIFVFFGAGNLIAFLLLYLWAKREFIKLRNKPTATEA